MSVIQKIALSLIIIGALNWGLVGIFDFNLVEWLFKSGSIFTKGIYIVIALCGISCVALLFLKNDHHLMDN